jgi:hypothetical protein
VRRVVAATVVVVLAMAASASAASPKLTTRDFNRVAGANGTAFGDVGLVMQHGCDPDARPCIAKAIAREAAADDRVAAIAKGLLPKLAPGPCRQAVAAMFSAWHRRAGLVRAAGRAWAVSEYHAATQKYYYAKWDIDRKNLVGSNC